jgi:hypothetical protein
MDEETRFLILVHGLKPRYFVEKTGFWVSPINKRAKIFLLGVWTC